MRYSGIFCFLGQFFLFCEKIYKCTNCVQSVQMYNVSSRDSTIKHGGGPKTCVKYNSTPIRPGGQQNVNLLSKTLACGPYGPIWPMCTDGPTRRHFFNCRRL